MTKKKILKEGEAYYLKNGTRIFVSPNPEEWTCDTILISEGPGNGVGSTIHVTVNPPESYDEIQGKHVNCEIVYYDNWEIKVCGSRKNKPTFILEDDEFPSTLIIRTKEKTMKVLKEKIVNEPLEK